MRRTASGPTAAASEPIARSTTEHSARRRAGSTVLTLACASGILVFLLLHVPPPYGAVVTPLVHRMTPNDTPTSSAVRTAPPPAVADPPAHLRPLSASSRSMPVARVALVMLVVGSQLPVWWPFLTTSYERNAPTYTLIVAHTGALPATTNHSAPHVRYAHVPLPTLQQRFVSRLSASPALVDAKFASGKGLSDLKPFYGCVFADLIDERTFTHWGWVDWDVLMGDLPTVIPERFERCA